VSGIAAVVPDLFFAVRISATARRLDVPVEMIAPERALERCREMVPTLLILDLHAAGDPLALARALKADESTRAIRIVGFHSHVDAELREAAVAAGVDQVLPRSAFTVRLSAILSGG
jgi:CheY-like chemotaxis protein